MALDVLIFLAILIPTSILIYKILKAIVKVLYFSVALLIAYLIIRFILL